MLGLLSPGSSASPVQPLPKASNMLTAVPAAFPTKIDTKFREENLTFYKETIMHTTDYNSTPVLYDFLCLVSFRREEKRKKRESNFHLISSWFSRHYLSR